jgi:hypothetical protein
MTTTIPTFHGMVEDDNVYDTFNWYNNVCHKNIATRCTLPETNHYNEVECFDFDDLFMTF